MGREKNVKHFHSPKQKLYMAKLTISSILYLMLNVTEFHFHCIFDFGEKKTAMKISKKM